MEKGREGRGKEGRERKGRGRRVKLGVCEAVVQLTIRWL